MQLRFLITTLIISLAATESAHAAGLYTANSGPRQFGTNLEGASKQSPFAAVSALTPLSTNSAGFGSGTASAKAGPGFVGATVILQVQNSTAVGFGTNTILGGWAVGISNEIEEFSIGAPGTARIPVSLNLQIDGTQAIILGSGGVFGDDISFSYAFSQPGSVAITGTIDVTDIPFSSLQKGFEFETPEGMFLPGVPISSLLQIRINAEIFDKFLESDLPNPMQSFYVADFGSTFSFSTTGPVWNLPEGVSIISDITPNNRFGVPEPDSSFLAAMAVAIGCFWSQRSRLH